MLRVNPQRLIFNKLPPVPQNSHLLCIIQLLLRLPLRRGRPGATHIPKT